MLKKTENAIKNEQFNIAHTRHKTKINKNKKTNNTQHRKYKQHGPHQKPRVNPGAHEW